MTATLDNGKLGRETRRGDVLCATHIGEKSVARFARDDEDGHDWQRRLVRRPSGTPPSVRDGSSRCQREKTACCACSILVRTCRI